MSSRTQLRRTRILLVLLGMVVIPVGASILYTFAPTQYSYFPCMLHQTTGLHCPGCGGTRCAHALLHGNLEQALAYNALFVILLPWLAYEGLRIACSLWMGRSVPSFAMPAWGAKLLVGVLILFFLARNIDVYPLNLLAPHEL